MAQFLKMEIREQRRRGGSLLRKCKCGIASFLNIGQISFIFTYLFNFTIQKINSRIGQTNKLNREKE